VTTPSSAQLARVSLLATDVDGVMTDGMLWYGDSGEALKGFHVRDGLGLKLLQEAGVVVAVISARRSPALISRLAELGVGEVLLGREDKRAAVRDLCARRAIALGDAAFVGDDILDLPAMRAVGLGVAVADAHPLVRAEAAWVTSTAGGAGALREVADAVLEARGGLVAAVDRHLLARR
jgi:3-deoxy-D-manno-octulosonate 8-phosphate phosphatase (KDO 8-P phosphatase)